MAEYVSSLERTDREFDAKHCRIIKRSSLEGASNIGGLSEGALHLCLKYFFEENNDFHEVYFDGFYADILRDGSAIEVQTKNFYAFRKKLSAVSEKIPVTVVHPIIKSKRIFWEEPDTGEVSAGRQSPVHGDIYGVFRELIYICEIVGRDTLSFCFPVLECSEYKLLCGRGAERKKGAVRSRFIPEKLIGFYEFDTAFAFACLMPQLSSESFTVKDIIVSTGMESRTAYAFVKVLVQLGILRKVGKTGRAMRYDYGENY